MKRTLTKERSYTQDDLDRMTPEERSRALNQQALQQAQSDILSNKFFRSKRIRRTLKLAQ
jgi:hypothetical protein